MSQIIGYTYFYECSHIEQSSCEILRKINIYKTPSKAYAAIRKDFERYGMPFEDDDYFEENLKKLEEQIEKGEEIDHRGIDVGWIVWEYEEDRQVVIKPVYAVDDE